MISRIFPLFLLVPAMLHSMDTEEERSLDNLTVRARLIDYNGPFDLPSDEKSPDIVVDTALTPDKLSKYPIVEQKISASRTCVDIRDAFAKTLKTPVETTRLYVGTSDRSYFQVSLYQIKTLGAKVWLEKLEGKNIDSNSGTLVMINCPLRKIENQ